MLYCGKKPNHFKIATCINENCYLRFKLLCMNCDFHSISKSHDSSCQFVEVASKQSFFSEINFFNSVNLLSKSIRKNKIVKFDIENEDTSLIPAEHVAQVIEINDCITMYNRYLDHLLQNLFTFIRSQREMQIRSKSYNIFEINKETALMRLQARNYNTIIKNLNEIVYNKHHNLNENIKQINIKVQFNILQGFCNDILSIINHFLLQIQGANTWFSEEKAKLLKKFHVENNNTYDNNISPELIKFCFDGFLMGQVIKQENNMHLKIYSQINQKKFSHYKLNFDIVCNQNIKDFDFSSCERYFAILKDDAFNLFQLCLCDQQNNQYTKKIQLQKIPLKFSINEKFEQVQFYFRRILVAVQNLNKLILLNYNTLQVVYEINSNFQFYFKKEMSMLSEFLLIKSDKSLDIFESNGSLTEVKVQPKMNVKEYYISQNYKYLLLVSQKDDQQNQTISLYMASKNLVFEKELMNTQVKKLLKAEFSKDSNYVYLLYDSHFEVIDTYILQMQNEKNIFLINKSEKNPYINFFQTIDGQKLYLIKHNGQVVVIKRVSIY
ncbi:hypothetical protein TTHERM_00188300 (macronuclear) [Tetrahymena thermophila SB210]|uniref:Uncharacterized protein n=1 Tax=Tetrahymena thermophila (strain SB210) TaxID=312017 RepID=I7LUX6_TETTS|nr:hypothetical protein TTHERM_00188300 [Tetrahymena thermophila SB210]EAR96261.1 hypothetical protein TTHERM_00188300 [Tetrahymena thermophila SB210]|eukprot:XP_001016506.1 hypothetical protein TTHERM_00188300 [Tetrahymena thermophila SB210]